MNSHRRMTAHRAIALAMAALGTISSTLLCGCGRSTTNASNAPYPGRPQQGMSTKQKVAVLAGAAALYYLYNKHKNVKTQGKQGQYYLSKNGRVYYRDQQGRPVWVTPPPQGIQVPESEAQAYSGYQGFNGSTTGTTFGGYGADSTPMLPGPPGPGGR
jgi:hypothetical protein